MKRGFLLCHINIQYATGHNLVVSDGVTLQLLTVQNVLLYINSLLATTMCADGEGLVLAYGDNSLFYDGRTQLVNATTGLNLIQTQSREDVPCRHLTNISLPQRPAGWSV